MQGQTQAYLMKFVPAAPKATSAASNGRSKAPQSGLADPQVPQNPRPPPFNPTSHQGTPRSRAPVPTPRPVGQIMRPSSQNAGQWRGQLQNGPSQPQRPQGSGAWPGGQSGGSRDAGRDLPGDGAIPQDPRKRRALQAKQEALSSAQVLLPGPAGCVRVKRWWGKQLQPPIRTASWHFSMLI